MASVVSVFVNKYSAIQDEIRAITEESKAINAHKKQLQEQLKAAKIPSSMKLVSKIKVSVPSQLHLTFKL